MENGFTLLEIAAVHHLGQRFAFFVIQKPEDGDFSNHRYGC